jgi:hypothetical protein
MNKRAQQTWPTWKIATLTLVCAIAGTAFLVAYVYLPPPSPAATQPAPAKAPGSAPSPSEELSTVGLANLVVLMGLVFWGAALTFAGWLAHRMYMRIPAWRRRQFFGRGR